MIPRRLPADTVQTFTSGRVTVYDGRPALILQRSPYRIAATVINNGPGQVLIADNPVTVLQGFGAVIPLGFPLQLAGGNETYAVAIPESFVAATSTLYLAWSTGNLDPILWGTDLATDLTVTETVRL